MSTATTTQCPKCGAGLVNINNFSGSVCPKGCGGVYPPVPKNESIKAAHSHRVGLLPTAIVVACVRPSLDDSEGFADGRFYSIEGTAGLFRRVARNSTNPNRVAAKCEGKAIALVKDEKTTSSLAILVTEETAE